MTGSPLGISITGLKVAQSNLSTTGHNIANANVEGYSRQTVNTVTNPATRQGQGYVGNGASVASIERMVNKFIVEQLQTDTSLFKGLEAYSDNLSKLDRLLSDSAAGLNGSLERFFSAMHNGADDPTSIPARQLIISESENLADKFNTIFERLDEINNSVDDFIRSSVAQVNSLVENIAKFNQRIGDAIGAANGAQPNDLLDQRDEAVRKLAELVSIQTYEQGNGQVNVVLGSGQNMVVGTESRRLDLQTSQSDVRKTDVVFANGEHDIIVTNLLEGGELGGLLRFQNNILDQTYNELGRVAIVMADTFNQTHQRGINLNDEFGENFFYDVNDSTIAENRVIGNSTNAPPNDRQMHLNIVDSNVITKDDYEVSIEGGGLFRIENLSTGEEVVSGVLTGVLPQSVEFDGFELVFERGSFQAGDSYKLIPTRSASRDFSSELIDASSIAFGSPLVTDASIGNTGTGAISPGEVLTLQGADGEELPLFATRGEMDPPLIVRFTTSTTYDVLDNSDPGNPVHLDPPIRNQQFVIGGRNDIFSTDPGETLIETGGDLIGLPAGRTPVVGGGPVNNGYPSEAVIITQPSAQAGVAGESTTLFTDINASARDIASQLSNINGVDANASNYMEITDVGSLTLNSPLQLTLNGESLIDYEFDSGVGALVVASVVPDPAVSEDDFNDYLADQINSNENLAAMGIYAVAGVDPVSGASELRVYSTDGDDFEISLEADGAGPDSMVISDGENPGVTLDGNGVGVTSAIAVGGSIDVRLADGINLSTFPSDSLLFGDTAAPDFARNTYTGIQASLQGQPDTGDTFTLNFNSEAAFDNRNALALSDLQNSNTMDNGGASYSDAYASLVETIGIESSASRINRDASEQVLEEVTKLRDSVSAVNLDEEAANLIRYEQLYSANAQVISVSRQLFDRLINSF